MGEGENGTNGESSTDSRTLPCVRYTADETLCKGELSQALCGGRRQEGGSGGRRHLCDCRRLALLYGRNPTTLQNNCFPIKRKLKKKKTHNVSQSTNKKDSDEALRDNDWRCYLEKVSFSLDLKYG